MILRWEPPVSFSDSTPLDPTRDLDRFEIYIKENSYFSESDEEAAALSAFDPSTGQVTTSFDLANLAPFVSQGVTYYISVRAVAMDGLKSDFSPSATFSY